MRCSFLLPTVVLLFCGCPSSDTAAPETENPRAPTPLPEPGEPLTGALARAALHDLLASPPHLPPNLRTTLARELASRVPPEQREAYRAELLRLGRTLRTQGLIDSATFAAVHAEAREAAAASLYGTDDPVRQSFYREHVLGTPDPASSESPSGLGRVLRLAAAGRAQLRRRQLAAATVLALPASTEVSTVLASAAAQEPPLTLASALRAQGVDPTALDGLADVAETTPVDTQLGSLLTATASRPSTQLKEELSALAKRLSELDAKIEEVAGALEAVVGAVRRESATYSDRIEGLVASDTSMPSLRRRARLQFAEASLSDRRPFSEREAELADEKGPYRYVTPEDRQEMKLALTEQKETRKTINTAFTQAGKATKAAGDVVDLLTAFEVVTPEAAADVHKGLDVTNAVLDLATAAAMRDPFAAVSAGVDLCFLLSGKEPPPSPEEARHEEVMAALDGLAEGQREIMDRLETVSEQVQAVHRELRDMHAIVRSTHALVVDQNLNGLRDCRNFLANLRFYAITRPDPLSGNLEARPELGLANYTQLLAHFRKAQAQELYTSANRFLNDQLRGKTLNVLRVAADDEQANLLRAAVATHLGKKPEWVRGQVLANQAQIVALLGFIQRHVHPDHRARVLGSLAYPSRTFDQLNAKLERVLDPKQGQPFAESFATLELDRTLNDSYNPLLVEEVARSVEALQSYRLVQLPGTAKLPEFSALAKAGYDPAQSFGSTRKAQHEQILAPLLRAERLVLQTTAQQTLLSGDILIPVLAGLSGMSTPFMTRRSRATRAANSLLASNATLRENVVRYLVYAQLRTPGRFPELHERASQLLPPSSRSGLTRFSKVDELTDFASGRYADAVREPAPFWREPGGLRDKDRVIQKPWPEGREWIKFYAGLNLHGRLPKSTSAASRALRAMDARHGSPFVVEESLDVGYPGQTKTARFYTRLPRLDEVESGAMITSGLLAPLSARSRSLHDSLVDYATCYPPALSEVALDRLHRELLLRELLRALH